MKIGKYNIDISNKEKIMFPDSGITKGDLLDYYVEISDLILPHIKQRPLTLRRYPDGLRKKGFFQKEKPGYFTSWIHSAKLERKEGGKIEMILAENKASLAYLANQACLVFHPWLSRADRPEYPDKMVFDLDPANDDFSKVKTAAKRLRELLEKDLKLTPYLMSTGSRGLHVVVAIRRDKKFSEVKEFASGAAHILAERYPDDLPDDIWQTTDIIYIRFHGKKEWYKYSYRNDQLEKWKRKILKLSPRPEEIYAYFNNDVNANAVDDAFRFSDILNN